MTAHDPWDWDAWLGDTHQHVTTLQDRIRQDAIRAAGGGLKAYNSPGLIDPQTGHTVGGELCSVCFSTLRYRAPLLPRFRCCYWCLHYDKTQARNLGLKMLLPLMDWHCQPILPGHTFPTDPHIRQLLYSVWTAAPLLEEWRQENVAREYTHMLQPGEPPIHIHKWMQHFGYGWHRSKHTWWHFVEVYAPGLAELLNERSSRNP
jgi:hypothetical protein